MNKKSLYGALAGCFILAGCSSNTLTQKQTIRPVEDAGITLDMSYLSSNTMLDNISAIKGFANQLEIGKYNKDNEKYYSKGDLSGVEGTEIKIGQKTFNKSGDNYRFDGYLINFKEAGGVYQSVSTKQFNSTKIDPLTHAESIPENSWVVHNSQWNIGTMRDMLSNTYSMGIVTLYSKYSPESIVVQLNAALKPHEINRKATIGEHVNLKTVYKYESTLVVDGKESIIAYTVRPYATGAIIMAETGIPVLVDGRKYIYGVNDSEVKKTILELIER